MFISSHYSRGSKWSTPQFVIYKIASTGGIPAGHCFFEYVFLSYSASLHAPPFSFQSNSFMLGPECCCGLCPADRALMARPDIFANPAVSRSSCRCPGLRYALSCITSYFYNSHVKQAVLASLLQMRNDAQGC